MRTTLKLLFGLILLGMLGITTAASLQQGIVPAARNLWPDLWFRATLLDAYFGFLTFYVWVFYKEPRPGARALWFVLIMCLGNIAMAVYVLIQLFRLPPGEPLATLLTRRNP
jgi:hypothetical protein